MDARTERDVFVIATANDITKLPPEFLRKVDLMKSFFVDLPDQDSRKEILKIHLKRRNLSYLNLELDELAMLMEGFSGAEIEQVIISALYSTLSDDVNITHSVLEKEITSTKPTVSYLWRKKFNH